MSTLRLVIVRLAWSGIVLAVLITLVLWFAPLEFKKAQDESTFYQMRCFVFSGCIWLLLIARLRFNNSLWVNVGQAMIAAIGPAILIAFQAFLSLFGSMCAWSEPETLFRSRTDAEHRIVIREFGCGAWDSDPSRPMIFEMKDLGGWFVYASQVDTTSIDRSAWVRLNKEQ